MSSPPHHIMERRANRRAQQRRRRRMAALAMTLGCVAVMVVLVVGLASGSDGRAHRASGPLRSGAPTSVASAAYRGRPLALGRLGNTVIRRLASLALPVYCAGPRGNAVAFTFDDGPGPYTHLALRKLAQAHERATFFDVGKSINAYPGYLRSELRLAAIGDHTYTHPFLPALPADGVASEIDRTKQLIESESGESVDLFRPPYGSHTPVVDQTAKRLGLLEILWNVDSADSLGANWAGIIKNVEAGLRPGSIILMHENRGQTIRALTTLLPELHRRHLRSVSLPELFATDPPSPTQLRRGPAGCGLSPAGTRTGS